MKRATLVLVVILATIVNACGTLAGSNDASALTTPRVTSSPGAKPTSTASPKAAVPYSLGHFPAPPTGALPAVTASALQAILDRAVSNLPGVSATVIVAGRGTWSGAAGTTNDVHAIPIDSSFGIASNTKTVIAAEIMLLADEGKLKLSDPVSAHLHRGFAFDTNGATVGNLLAMESGIPDPALNNTEYAADLMRNWSVQDVLETVPAATFDRAYSRRGDVKSETQTIPSLSGSVATGQQIFHYDALHRVIDSTLGSETRAYTYDASSNRLTEIDAGAINWTTTWAYDKTDEILTQKVGTGIAYQAIYDAFGNLTSAPAPDGSSGAQVSTFDKADHLLSVGPSGGTQTVFTIDALGRHRTRKVGAAPTDTYTYAGTSEAVVRIEQTASIYTDSALDANGDRLATNMTNGATSVFGWLLPDLHGDVAAGLDSSGGTVTDAFRFDPYGKLIGTPVTTGPPSPWRYQGRLLETTPGGSDPDLYDFGFRAYAPTVGAFISLDDVSGSAQNPLSLNRFLYAAANPETLVDPDGHCLRWIDDRCADHQETPQQHYERVNAKQITTRRNEHDVEHRINRQSGLTNGQIAARNINGDQARSAAYAKQAAINYVRSATAATQKCSGVCALATAFAGLSLASIRAENGLLPAGDPKVTGVVAKVTTESGYEDWSANSKVLRRLGIEPPTEWAPGTGRAQGHAETNALSDAWKSGVQGETVTMEVDVEPCFYCAEDGGIQAHANAMKSTVEVVTPTELLVFEPELEGASPGGMYGGEGIMGPSGLGEGEKKL